MIPIRIYDDRYFRHNYKIYSDVFTPDVHPETGQSVIIDNTTKGIIHVGGKDLITKEKEMTYEINVKLLDEGVEVWRPVSSIKLSDEVYKIAEQEIPDGEIWEYQPGDIVRVKLRESFGKKYLVCTEKLG